MLLSFADLVGRLHPVLVHLPIGILLLACFFQWLVLNNRYSALQSAIPAMLFWGMLSAIFSCITGYLLSQSGDYDQVLVGRHQWLGISTAAASLVLYLLYQLSISEKYARWGAAIVIALVAITGHLGGSLTHGSGYLTEGWSSSGEKGGPALQPVPNIQEAGLYTQLVQPLLQARCYSCHGPNKQKGKLRLDQPGLIMKGGEDGKAIIPGKSDESKMIERLLLPMTDKDHMPPREKPQLTANEIALLHWWVGTGADFNKKVKELPATEKIKPVLLAFQSGAGDAPRAATDVPEETVARADEADILRLTKAGVIVTPIAQNSNYLTASFFTAGTGADSLLKLLAPLKKQLIWLKLDNAVIGDASADELAKLSSLTRLQLNHTGITDKGLAKLAALTNLQSLNLVGTKVTAQGVQLLRNLKKLKHLYLYQTEVVAGDWPALKKSFPNTDIDSGKYIVPTFVTDTTQVKAP